jgi:hypothetical protein
MTRIAPRGLDDDNLAASFKGVQDGIAWALGIDDRKIKWTYEQRSEGTRKYAVKVEITRAEPKG